MIERTYCQQSYIHQQNLFRSLLLFVRQRVSLRWLCPLVHDPLRYQIILRKKYRHMFVENRQITDNSEIGRYEQHCSFEKGELRLTFIAALGLFSLFFSFFFFFFSTNREHQPCDADYGSQIHRVHHSSIVQIQKVKLYISSTVYTKLLEMEKLCQQTNFVFLINDIATYINHHLFKKYRRGRLKYVT